MARRDALSRRVCPHGGGNASHGRTPSAIALGAATLACAAAMALVGPGAASAQQSSRGSAQNALTAQKIAPGKQMLVTANEMHYDYTNDRISAVGNVQIYHDASVLEADKVTFDRKSNKVHAEGNVRLKNKDGDVVYAERLELTQDFKRGFIDSLRLEGRDNTRFAAARADRREGDVTVLRSGVYTACEPCKDDPTKPPLWQVKAARIIHKEGERMVYYEDATVELFGLPIAYFPYMSHPDPTVRRKSGFLVPRFMHTSKIGAAVEIPYFWAIAPNYDLTLSPTPTTKQGLLMQAEWRHRLINGAYTIRAAGIVQADKDEFIRPDGTVTPGFRDNRGMIETNGEFWLNEKWKWGWNATLLSDRTFLQDYDLTNDIFGRKETKSQIYLVGQGDRSYFDIRSVYHMGLSELDRQKEMPVIHPVMDYNYTFLPPVFGGELGFNVNLTSMSRTDADLDKVTGFRNCTSSDPLSIDNSNCLMRGAPGNYTRLSADLSWKRTLIDPTTGIVAKPFAEIRGDVAWRDATNRSFVSGFIDPAGEAVYRGMPAVGIEYRWPFISVHNWGSQTLEPIAQFVARPNETRIRALPNEDAQSLVFDDANLFEIDKFSGYDRIEGGGRLNAGLQYTAHINGGGIVNALFGQSYHLFGRNSFSRPDMANTGLESGLETRTSDYVARVYYQPNAILSTSSRFRFDRDDFSVQRMEFDGTARFERFTVTALYGRYAPQPLLGYTSAREAVIGGGSVKLTDNWSLNALWRYDIERDRLDGTNYGISYIDECFGLALNYITDFTRSGNPETVHKIMLRVDLRTLGDGGFSTRVGSSQ